MDIIKRTSKYLVYTLTSVLVLFSMYTFFITKVFGQPYVDVFGYTYFIVATGSMSGTIEVNDIVIVNIGSGYQVGDIVTYQEKGAFVTHRVESIGKDTITTKGDINNIVDDPVKKENVVGRVSSVISFESILKAIAVLVFLIIIYLIFNFESIFKKYILKEKKKSKKGKTPLDYTQTISVKNDTKIPLVHKDEVEILETEEGMEFVNLLVKQLRLKHKNKKLKLTTEGSLKLKYLYELALLISIDSNQIPSYVKDKPFEELYDYDMENVPISKEAQEKLYEMPIYVFLMLLSYTLIYDENEYFDTVFKIMKYRILIDKNDSFYNDKTHIKDVLSLIEKIVETVGHSEKFELKDIKERLINNKSIKNISSKK